LPKRKVSIFSRVMEDTPAPFTCKPASSMKNSPYLTDGTFYVYLPDAFIVPAGIWGEILPAIVSPGSNRVVDRGVRSPFRLWDKSRSGLLLGYQAG
jgi:hypothetical protein